MKIKFVVEAKRYHDRTNGNTYHSCRVTRCRDGKTIVAAFEYGHGDAYRMSAMHAMVKAKWLPVKYRNYLTGISMNLFLYENQNDWPIYWAVSDVTKSECKANGMFG